MQLYCCFPAVIFHLLAVDSLPCCWKLPDGTLQVELQFKGKGKGICLESDASLGHEIYCHELKVMGWNLGQVELEVCSTCTSVYVVLKLSSLWSAKFA